MRIPCSLGGGTYCPGEGEICMEQLCVVPCELAGGTYCDDDKTCENHKCKTLDLTTRIILYGLAALMVAFFVLYIMARIMSP